MEKELNQKLKLRIFKEIQDKRPEKLTVTEIVDGILKESKDKHVTAADIENTVYEMVSDALIFAINGKYCER